MTTRFHFADAFWFRVPLKTIVVALSVFAILSLYPALGNGSSQDQQKAIFGFTVLAAFIVMASIFAVAVNDSHVTIEDDALHIHFEAFFDTRFPLAYIVRVSEIDPSPGWRYRFGLSTTFEDRIACSHGGRMVEIELERPCITHLWPRRIAVRRYWLAVVEPDEFLATLRERAPHAFETPVEAAA